MAPSRDNPVVGIACLMAAACLIPVSDAFAKYLTGYLPVVQVAAARYVLQTVFLLPIVIWWFGLRAFRTDNPGLQMVRGLLITISVLCFFTAVSYLPLADAVAMFFVNPFVVTALSALLLGERVGVWRWSAVVAGFIGVLIVIRPGFETVGIGTIAALGAGLSYSLFVIATRRLAGSDPALVTTFLTGLVASVLITPMVPSVWVMPGPETWLALCAMGVLGSCFSVLVVLAYEKAEASQLAPIGYVEIAAAVAVGWIGFGDFPDGMTWIGMAVIVASGLVIVWRERHVRRRGRHPVAAVPGKLS